MPSSYSSSLRFELQFTGENVNTWGVRLNTLFTRADFAIAGISIIPLTGAYTLTSSNSADDQARAAVLKFTGSPAASSIVTIPSVTKTYRIWNACTTAIVISAGGTTVSIDPSDVVDVFCDGTDVKATGFNNLSLKDYIGSVVLGTLSGVPAVSGNAGKFFNTDGASGFWKFVMLADIPDYAADRAALRTELIGITAALAISL